MSERGTTKKNLESRLDKADKAILKIESIEPEAIGSIITTRRLASVEQSDYLAVAANLIPKIASARENYNPSGAIGNLNRLKASLSDQIELENKKEAIIQGEAQLASIKAAVEAGLFGEDVLAKAQASLDALKQSIPSVVQEPKKEESSLGQFSDKNTDTDEPVNEGQNRLLWQRSPVQPDRLAFLQWLIENPDDDVREGLQRNPLLSSEERAMPANQAWVALRTAEAFLRLRDGQPGMITASEKDTYELLQVFEAERGISTNKEFGQYVFQRFYPKGGESQQAPQDNSNIDVPSRVTTPRIISGGTRPQLPSDAASPLGSPMSFFSDIRSNVDVDAQSDDKRTQEETKILIALVSTLNAHDRLWWDRLQERLSLDLGQAPQYNAVEMYQVFTRALDKIMIEANFPATLASWSEEESRAWSNIQWKINQGSKSKYKKYVRTALIKAKNEWDEKHGGRN